MDARRLKFRNRILAGLAPADLALLQPHLVLTPLPVRKLLEARNRRIENVYFLESGLASVVVTGGSNQSLEVAMIGNESMTGLAILMGTDRSPNETFIQSAGEGWRIGVPELRLALEQSPGLQERLLQYGHTMVVQQAYTALSNGKYKIEERLARWLLMAMDRSDGTAVLLTHEFLAVMLGVRRPGVTSAINHLEKRGMIASRRGAVTVLDRAGMEDAANGSYGAPEAEYERLFGLRI